MKKLLPSLTLTALLVSSLSAQNRDRNQRPDHDKADQPKIEKIDWDRFKERIEGAVKRGDITRDQANQKYTELKKRIGDRPQAKRDQALRENPENSRQAPGERSPDALGRVLGELIAQKKINRDDARRIFEAVRVGRPQVPARQDRRIPQGEVAEELRDVLNQARRELAELRETRRGMAREHGEHEHHQDQQAELRERAELERRERTRETRERAEMRRDRAEEEEAQAIRRTQQELERHQQELKEPVKMIEKQRRQFEEARRALEKQKRERKEEKVEK
jgi:hypothetical protein